MSGAPRERLATCHCGRLQLRCTGEPAKISLCHCLDCQRRTGSLFSVAVFFPRAAVALVAGSAKRFRRASASGFDVTFHFCPECGSSLWWEPDRLSDRIGVAVGAFADPDFPMPEQAVWAQDQHAWLTLPENIAAHERNPVKAGTSCPPLWATSAFRPKAVRPTPLAPLRRRYGFEKTPSYISDKNGGSAMISQGHYQLFGTAAGVAAIGWKGAGIASFRLPAPTAPETERAILRHLPGARRAEPPAGIAAVINAAIRYFEGERVEFFEAPVELGESPPFFARVYAHVRGLGWGQTTTYGAVARALDAGPEHARAVGQAMATNPVPLIIPCHRVMAAGGGIGGFSAPGGALSKARMLELEGVPVAPVQHGFDF